LGLVFYKICTKIIRGCHAIWCWRGFEGVGDLSLVLTVSGFGYLENRSFELTPERLENKTNTRRLNG